MREQSEESDIHVSVSGSDKGKEDTNSGLSINDKHEDPAHSASIYNEEQSEGTFSNHDDTAKEDSFDGMNVGINDVAKDISPEDSELTASVTLTRNDSNLSVYVSKEEIRQEQDEISQLQTKNLELQFQLKHREGQLASKGEQIALMEELHEEEKQTLEGKVRETKEEAKKRIMKAKERVESMQIKLTEANIRADSTDNTKGEQDEIIQALRMEGESLARKQGEMEHALRQSRREVRDLKSDLEEQTELREKADDKIKNMKNDLETKRNELKSAKQGVHRADKLDSDLMAAKEEKEKNSTIIRGLEHEVKEVKLKNTALKKKMDSLLKEKIEEGEVEILQVRKEKDQMLNDLELKLRSSAKEANVREDALRQEVEELRKRWQDSVRRCDGTCFYMPVYKYISRLLLI
jgi:chromosome segregation ATPase